MAPIYCQVPGAFSCPHFMFGFAPARIFLCVNECPIYQERLHG